MYLHSAELNVVTVTENVNTQPAQQALGSSGHKKKRAREKETRERRGSASPSREPVLSFARYFQAPATQASKYFPIGMNAREPLWH